MIDQLHPALLIGLGILAVCAVTAAMCLWVYVAVKRIERYARHGFAVFGLLFLAGVAGGIAIGFLEQLEPVGVLVLLLGSLCFALLLWAGFASSVAVGIWARKRLAKLRNEKLGAQQREESPHELDSGSPD